MWLLSAHRGHILVCGLAQNLTTNVCQHNIQRRLPLGFQMSHRNIFYECFSSHQDVIQNNFKRTSLPIFFKTRSNTRASVVVGRNIFSFFFFHFQISNQVQVIQGVFFFVGFVGRPFMSLSLLLPTGHPRLSFPGFHLLSK